MKTLMTSLGTIALAFGVATPTLAQQTPPPNQCEINEHFSDFDFWVGDWNVYATNPSGETMLVGTNLISKIAGDCLLWEHWTNTNGNMGYSMNYFDPLDNQWRQVWVSQNLSIDYTGGLNEDGAMVLEGTIHYYGNGNTFPFRGIWTAQEDGSVIQHFDQYDPEAETWNVWFEGHYVRKEIDPNPPAAD